MKEITQDYSFIPRYTRGCVCKTLGITKDTLRHYEKCGIINPHINEKNKYKYYSIADIEILGVILLLRGIDVSISDIPRFIRCNDINNYTSLLDEHIDKVNNKIKSFNHVLEVLKYLKGALEAYKQYPSKGVIKENTILKLYLYRIDYNNTDITKVLNHNFSTNSVDNIIKVKIVNDTWIDSNRLDTSELIVGQLCNDENSKNAFIVKIDKALTSTTLEKDDNLPNTIKRLKEEYGDKYEFYENVYIMEHTFLNIFNQDELLRTIYIPISKVL